MNMSAFLASLAVLGIEAAIVAVAIHFRPFFRPRHLRKPGGSHES